MAYSPVSWFEFWKRRKVAFLTALCFLLAGMAFIAHQRLLIHEDIREILPNDASAQSWADFMEQSGTMRAMLFAIAVSEEDGYERLDSLSQAFTRMLAEESEWITDVRMRTNADEKELFQFMLERIPLMMDEQDYDSLRKKIEPAAITETMLANYQRLQTIEGMGLKTIIAEDPLLLSLLVKDKLETFSSMKPFEVNEGLLMTKNRDGLLATAKAAPEFSSAEKQQYAAEKLARLQEKWNRENPRHPLRYFAGFLVGVENAKQVKKDTRLTVLLAVGGILLVLLFYFRNVATPVLFLLPSAFGLLFSLAVTTLVKGEISGIAIGISAVVIGITMDYAFHFFTHLKESGDIRQTLNDITAPLLTGCFTTVMAFGALSFTDSKLLQDFGFFALCSLIGAILFVLFALPALLAIFKFKLSPPATLTQESNAEKFQTSKKIKFLLALLLIGFSIFMLRQAFSVQFDGNPETLAYYPEQLKADERYFQGIVPGVEKRAFLLASENDNHAQYRAWQLLDSLYHVKQIKSYQSAGWFYMPDALRQKSYARWNRFWDEYRDNFLADFNSAARKAGFNPQAFNSFKGRIASNYQPEQLPVPEWMKEMPVVPGKGMIHSFTVAIDKKEDALALLSSEPLVKTLDPSAMSKGLLASVQNDFNYILLVSSLIVFLTIWAVYGRLELALITFLPMVLAWVWIVGLCATFGLKFNFSNILMTTFIFGLGDDYAIFVSDAYLNKFRSGKNLLAVYRKGIVLSAVTTIIGTGALIFTRHPALNSIALISVVGLCIILLVSFTVQPVLFHALIFNRTEKKRSPYTLKGFILSLFAFSYFLLGCLLAYLIQLLLRIVPAPQKKKKFAFHHVLRFFCGSLIYVMLNVKKRIYGKENFDFARPSILIANHSSFLDILALVMLHPKIVLLTNKWVYYSPFFGASIRYADYVYAAEGYENNLEQFRELAADGYSIVIYPEGTRSPDGTIRRFHKGAFYLAEKLNLDITPVLLHGFHFTMSKHDFLLKDGFLNMKALPRIAPGDKKFGENYSDRTKSISRYFKEQHALFKDERETHDYIYPRMLLNYIYKHPSIEWYLRIKWKSARSNYEYFDRHIPKNAVIYDLGCGLGFLAYYLAFRSDERKITAIDYDEEKIAIAQNNYERTENIQFRCANIEQVILGEADVIFLNDVLHYLSEQAQSELLDKCAAALRADGILFIRDGATDKQKEKHLMTRLSEVVSTGIGFNKTRGDLHFFESNFIYDFAKRHGLQCEVAEESKNTSNILFVIRKKA